jgi:Reverse transcriptase (RNA-dependent DNA polymerase).
MSHNRELLLVFTDLEKVYDSIPHSNLWKSMAETEINGIIPKVLKEYNTDNLHMSKLVMNYQIQLKLQKALDKFALLHQFYLISI